MDDRRQMKRAFTMVELAIVLVLVVVVATAVTPTIMRVFDLNASAQAFNIMASQLRSARASAVANNSYAAVHHQKADHTAPGQRALRDRFFVAVLHQEVETSLHSQIHISDGVGGGVTTHGIWGISTASDDTGLPQYENGGVNGSGTYVEFVLKDLPHLREVSEYNVYMRWGAPASGRNVTVEIYHARDDNGRTSHATLITQSTVSREWDLIGQFPFNVNGDKIVVKTEGATGNVVLGGFLLAGISGNQVFGMAPGQTVKQLPGAMAFGELKET
ncbi:MAG: prepilin-type N-terminal cleavage/methylation domain-containing protein, partial [Planctomycetota bacterium]